LVERKRSFFHLTWQEDLAEDSGTGLLDFNQEVWCKMDGAYLAREPHQFLSKQIIQNKKVNIT
jgi:hypothetical protein